MSADLLNAVQDKVWADPRWQPTTDAKGIETTHCNQAALAVADGLGCHAFDPGPGAEPYTADQLYDFFQREDSGFVEKLMADVQALANEGSLVYAVLNAHMLAELHGHIVSITTGRMVFSGELSRSVPVCLNIAGKKYDSRRTSLTMAFPMMRVTPRFFAWKASLV